MRQFKEAGAAKAPSCSPNPTHLAAAVGREQQVEVPQPALIAGLLCWENVRNAEQAICRAASARGLMLMHWGGLQAQMFRALLLIARSPSSALLLRLKLESLSRKGAEQSPKKDGGAARANALCILSVLCTQQTRSNTNTVTCKIGTVQRNAAWQRPQGPGIVVR